MSDERLLAADRVPTLTEVVDVGTEATPALLPAGPGLGVPAPEAALDAATIAAEVLADLAQRIDAHFETRLREALAPALARVADGLIREARHELALVLGELVEGAVKRALERREPS